MFHAPVCETRVIVYFSKLICAGCELGSSFYAGDPDDAPSAWYFNVPSNALRAVVCLCEV